jgi:hypothetical protein
VAFCYPILKKKKKNFYLFFHISVKGHPVAIFSPDSHITYLARNTTSHLLHVYLRFRPMAASGFLVTRGSSDDVIIFLSSSYLVVNATLHGCTTSLITPNKITVRN